MKPKTDDTPTPHPRHATIQALNELVEKASDPIVSSRAIHHALTNPYPKTRYLVGNVNGTRAHARASCLLPLRRAVYV